MHSHGGILRGISVTSVRPGSPFCPSRWQALGWVLVGSARRAFCGQSTRSTACIWTFFTRNDWDMIRCFVWFSSTWCLIFGMYCFAMFSTFSTMFQLRHATVSLDLMACINKSRSSKLTAAPSSTSTGQMGETWVRLGQDNKRWTSFSARVAFGVVLLGIYTGRSGSRLFVDYKIYECLWGM